ncbi:hypothetical protein DP113_30305 [Brasilonema octagenarum UFV-E1]|uniref:Uncharacterized protein n=2 Tax=Brasilonema TaxID=383614 RepID=A0A856MJP1_9CYAN|nr:MULTISPECIES: hypothetical protein [Brasilonema]NMF65501.1 hypothetical protein [Brasilonema octagenarum UFV-OR1]QDL11595.1 hypothetical protein DP114_30165 [Brasilonema sennae CENA114]QDL17973.1 hypothetical protein DP113_30305 [Brasilonema octagenarum UFV-E1]
MKKWKNQLLLSLTGACLAVGYSSLLATGNDQQSQLILKKNLLAQSEINPNVNEYLEKNKPESYKTLKKKLDEAIQDAKRPSQDKVVNNLWRLSISNSKIKTRIKNGKTEFLMVSWKYIKNPNEDWKPGLKQIENQTWLTASTQVKDFCHTCKGLGMKISGDIMLSLRLQQYLGLILNKNSNKTHFVEMWVKAEDLSRPCLNSKINNSSCQVFAVPPINNPVLQKIYKNSFEGEEHYPWTGLGYTYDWGNPQKPHVGASEFIINATVTSPITVEVVSITATKEYCKNKYLTASH